MHRFDYSFLDNALIPSNFVNLTSSISSIIFVFHIVIDECFGYL